MKLNEFIKKPATVVTAFTLLFGISATGLGISIYNLENNNTIQGEKGEQGEQGLNGLTPYIGTNGNWWVGSQDLLISAKGDKGDTGSSGTDGSDGASFLQGTSNPTNTTGKNGDTYLNTTSYDLFYKSENQWSLVGNIQGPTVIEEYLVTFNTNSGSEISPQKVLAGHHIVVPQDPVKEEYKFTGWTLEDGTYLGSYNEPLYFNMFSPTSDVTLYATYEVANKGKVIVNRLEEFIEDEFSKLNGQPILYRELESLVYDGNNKQLKCVVLSEPEGAPGPGGGQLISVLSWDLGLDAPSYKEEVLETIYENDREIMRHWSVESIVNYSYTSDNTSSYQVLRNHIGDGVAKGCIYAEIESPSGYMYSGITKVTSNNDVIGYISEYDYRFDNGGSLEDTSNLIQCVTNQNDEYTLWYETLEYIYNKN